MHIKAEGNSCISVLFKLYFYFFSPRFMPAALAFLILIALTNYVVIFFSCYGLSQYGAWLNKYHRVDLWLHRLLVRYATQPFTFSTTASESVLIIKLSVLQIQNGIAIYATWTTIASLVNLTIVLVYNANVSDTDAATISLSLLTVVVVAWYVQIRQKLKLYLTKE